MRVLIAGNKIYLGEMLEHYGVTTMTVPHVPVCAWMDRDIQDFDPDISLVFGVWRWHWILRTQLLPGIKIYRVQGSDAYTLDRKTRWLLKHLHVPLLYASETLKDMVQLPGDVMPTPINTMMFTNYHEPRGHDVLYYCPVEKGVPRADTYCLLDAYTYRIAHPDQSITILDGSTPYKDMPDVYNDHTLYLRYTTHDANPKMPYEAVLCGCRVIWNGVEVTEVPDMMRMDHAIPRFIEYFHRVLHEYPNN